MLLKITETAAESAVPVHIVRLHRDEGDAQVDAAPRRGADWQGNQLSSMLKCPSPWIDGINDGIP